jgi:hypothetical protein
MGKDEDINPVVVLSCIFMEDKRSETEADGIINLVIFSLQPLCLLFFTLLNADSLFVLLFR